VLVTGGARRLGRRMVERCAGRGWDVVIHYRSSDREARDLAEAVAGQGVKAACVGGDLADPDATRTIIPRAAEAAGRPLTGLVNSASLFDWDDITGFTPDDFLKHMLPNTLAPCLLIQGLLAQLPAGVTGAVVNILDQKLTNPNGDHFTYTLSKFALAGATETLARACAPRLRLNAVAPGYTLPAPGQKREDFERLHGRTPLGIGPQADDIADAVVWLLEAPCVTGQVIQVDAGERFLNRTRDISFDPEG